MRNPFEEKKTRKQKLILPLVAVIFVFIFARPTLRQYGEWLSAHDELVDIDAVIAQNPSAGRLETAVDIYMSGRADKIFIVSTPPNKVDKIVQSKDLNREHVYEASCLGTTTWDEAKNIKMMLEEEELTDKVLVVISNKYALRRMRWAFQEVLGSEYVVKAYPASHTNQQISHFLEQEDWWNNKFSRADVSSETQKLVFYWVYYGILNNDESVNIPFRGVFHYMNDWRVRQPGYDKTLEERIRRRCNDAW